jgi:F420-dependent oxidoreductase-like protein
MKLGLELGYSGARLRLPIDMVLRAEQLGYDSVWTAETYGSDAVTPLAYIGALTKRIRLATGVVQLAARTPANLAMCAQTLDAMCGEGRVVVGIGMSGPQIVEGWYGQPWGKPNYRMRDYVAIVKKILRRDGPVSHEGREISLPYRGPGSSGLGKPLKSILHGNPNIPIYLGTSTPLNIRMAAEVSDGWLSMNWMPKTARANEKLIAEGLAKRTDGRTRKDFGVIGMVTVTLTKDTAADIRAAIDAEKPGIALYVGGMGAKDKNFHKDVMTDCGYGDAANRIQELYLAGRKDEANAAVPDEFVDDLSLIGPEARIRERWKAWADSGADSLCLKWPAPEAMEAMARIAL